MAAKVAPSVAAMMGSQHTSGIYSDMSVDGPEIGTLVVIVDRAKNLPNRKSMGKQNPYCAARLGKEAKKTETDRRGGQTPRWDQELRFTVHDSLDYHNLKISIFSEDKKTDLIGEAWINLDGVITPGGGKNDMWQNLLFKGKYAGEIRIELTFYDSRPKPERKVASEDEVKLRQQSSSEKVRRRPLPNNPNAPARTGLTPDTIPQLAAPGRAKHGPREFSTPQRANSLPPDAGPAPSPMQVQQPQYYTPPPQPSQHFIPQMYAEESLPIPLHTEYEEKYLHLQDQEAPYAQPDFLPTLPPAPRQRSMHDVRYTGAQSTPPAQHPIQPPGLHHAHSDPVVPYQIYHDEHYDQGLHTTANEPLPDLEYQHRYVQQRHQAHDMAYSTQHYMTEQDPPPQPPQHSRSMSAQAPSATGHNATPPGVRPVSRGQAQYAQSTSPLQSMSRNGYDVYNTSSQGYQQRGAQHEDTYSSQPRGLYSDVRTLPSARPQTEISPQQRGPLPRGPPQHRYSAADQYISRQSPHPLSQEVRTRSPVPDMYPSPSHAGLPLEQDGYQMELNRHSITPVIKPRPISPAREERDAPHSGAQRKSRYSIQNPVRAFESSDGSPLSRTQPPTSNRSTPRKSVSPHPSPAQPSFPGGVPYGPDSFDVHNPAVHSKDAEGPYDQAYNEGSKKTITGWDGREIDPSDHLPVASWAPEPEVKAQPKVYGLGRDRDFGPRAAEYAAPRLSKDTMVNVRRKGDSADASPSTTIRARLVKKSNQSNAPMPLSEHANYNPVPDPYAQQDYSRAFTEGGPGINGGYKSTYDSSYPANQYGPPDLPPKVPLQNSQDALSREIASIDIGSAPRRTQPPVAYVPVRSHRDRNSFY